MSHLLSVIKIYHIILQKQADLFLAHFLGYSLLCLDEERK